jgi:hypothetical protein
MVTIVCNLTMKEDDNVFSRGISDPESLHPTIGGDEVWLYSMFVAKVLVDATVRLERVPYSD